MSVSIDLEQKIQVTMPCISMKRGVLESEGCSIYNGHTMRIIKNENEHLSYRVSAFYKGIAGDLPIWSFVISGKVNDSFRCTGSTTLELTPVNKITLAMQKITNGKKEPLWIDLSDARNYCIYTALPLSSEKVEDWVAKGLLFKTTDGRKPETILYSKYGVFLRTKEEIYYAGESEKFTRCLIRKLASARPKQALDERKQGESSPRSISEDIQNTESSWKVRLPKKLYWHTLKLIENRTKEGKVYIRGASWDGTFLTTLQVPEIQEDVEVS